MAILCSHSMAGAYSNDLRRKFLQAYEKGRGTLAELAERFGVSVGWAKKISARRTRSGQMERPAWRRGPQSRVTAAVQGWLREQIRRQPDLTLMELQQQLQAAQGVRLSIGCLWGALQQMGLRLQKSHSTPRSKTRQKRSAGGKHGGKRSA
jgi:transposase